MLEQCCARCRVRPRRWRDSYCRLCRNDIVRIWKAKKRYGDSLDGYVPYVACEEKREAEREPAPPLRGTPTRKEKERLGLL